MNPRHSGGHAPTPATLSDRAVVGARRARQAAEQSQARAPTPITAATAASDLDRLRAANTEAATFYRQCLTESTSPRTYLTSRVSTNVLTKTRWAIGYAPPGWTRLTIHLRALGFTDDELLAAGLARRSSRGTLIDVFRDRLTFALHDLDGHIIGFIGRAAPGATGIPQRYLNTAETPLFHKGKALFGLWEQLPQITSTDRPLVLVEGVFDALAIRTVCNPGTGPIAIAPSGTALTRDQADLIARTAGVDRPIILAFDADPAGRQAAVRAWTTLGGDLPSATGRYPRPMTHLQLPPGSDPNDVLHHRGPDALRQILTQPQHRQPMIDLVLDHRLEPWHGHLDFIESRIAAARAVAPLIAAQPPADIGRLVIRIAGQLGLDFPTVTGLVADAIAAEPKSADLSRGSTTPRPTTSPTARARSFTRSPVDELAAISSKQDHDRRPPPGHDARKPTKAHLIRS